MKKSKNGYEVTLEDMGDQHEDVRALVLVPKPKGGPVVVPPPRWAATETRDGYAFARRVTGKERDAREFAVLGS